MPRLVQADERYPLSSGNICRATCSVPLGRPVSPAHPGRAPVLNVLDAGNSQEVEVDVAHDVGSGPLRVLEALQEHVVADTV